MLGVTLLDRKRFALLALMGLFLGTHSGLAFDGVGGDLGFGGGGGGGLLGFSTGDSIPTDARAPVDGHSWGDYGAFNDRSIREVPLPKAQQQMPGILGTYQPTFGGPGTMLLADGGRRRTPSVRRGQFDTRTGNPAVDGIIRQVDRMNRIDSEGLTPAAPYGWAGYVLSGDWLPWNW